MNLKEILLSKNLISEDDWKCYIQQESKPSDDAFIDFLLATGLADKKQILSCLSEINSIPEIDLSGVEPEKSVTRLIPATIQQEMGISPFEFVYQTNSLKIASLRRLEPNELQKISEFTGIKNVECFITYRSNLVLFQIEHLQIDSGLSSRKEPEKQKSDSQAEELCPGIIVLSPDKNYDLSFWNEISKHKYDVYIYDTIKEAVEMIEQRIISKLFIQSNEKSRFAELEECFISKNSSGTVSYFLTERNLIFENLHENLSLDLLKDNFSFLKTVVASDETYKSKHIDQLVPLVELLCSKLCLSKSQTVLTIGAAYLHDITYLVMDRINPHCSAEDICRLSAEYLKSFKYTKSIYEIISLMYSEVQSEAALHEQYLCANIICVADYFCHSTYNQKKISVDLYKKFKEDLDNRSGKMFLPLVVQALSELIYQRIYISRPENEACSVLVYNNSGEDKLLLKNCLENLGFDVSQAGQIADFSKQYKANRPDILILEVFQSAEHTLTLLDTFRENNVIFETLPVYILSHQQVSLDPSELLQQGIEDIFYVPQDIDPFLIKIIRSKKRIIELSKQNMKILSGKGTFGSLTDMNLIDLLQTMNGSGKTFVISITAYAQQLTIYVDNGIIMGAESDDFVGVEAIYKSLSWDEGVWNIDPILLENIPDPNINRSINSVLLEGCQHLDESGKIGTTASVDNLNFPE